LKFIDEGYSGATLVRPALERLRDVVYGGALDLIYIQSPDRLSRKYAYQILLIDEFRRAGVEVVFLNRQNGETPEDELLLQVQGVVAEYERAKIMERSRRGKLHAAKQGSVSVLAGAPYGYRYIPKRASEDGEARYEIFFEEARVVQQIFEWVGKERATLRDVCRRLGASGVKTRTGKTWWQPTSVSQILRNSAYIGQAAFGKTKYGPKHLRLRPHKGHGEQPRNQYSIYSVPEEEWIRIAVPAIITPALFETVQEQIAENRSSARVRKDGAKYLLQGLTGCKQCGHAYYAKPCVCGKDKSLFYTYYRCVGGDSYRHEGGIAACDNKPIRGDLLEKAVWDEVVKILQKPDCLEKEYKRRLATGETNDAARMASEQKKLRNSIARMIDGYADGIIEKREFEPRIKQARAKLARIESQLQKAQETADAGRQLRLLIVQLGDFSSSVLSNLQSLDFETKRSVIRALVKRIDIDRDSVNVTFRFGDIEMPKTKAG
jgi:site-specific DNA recombinase